MKIRLQGAKNIRDFSEYGYRTYIRSAHLNGLTPGDVEILTNKYDVRTVIDLRTTQEVKEKPDVEIPGVSHIHIPIFDEVMPGVSHENEANELGRTLPDMKELYHALVTEEEYVSQINKVMQVLSDTNREGAVLWHCTEGKDRCGIISAMFLLSQGVHPKLVMKDYLKTNRVNFIKSWKYFFLILLSGRGAAAAGKVRDAFQARREYMEPIMDVLIQLAQASLES